MFYTQKNCCIALSALTFVSNPFANNIFGFKSQYQLEIPVKQPFHISTDVQYMSIFTIILQHCCCQQNSSYWLSDLAIKIDKKTCNTYKLAHGTFKTLTSIKIQNCKIISYLRNCILYPRLSGIETRHQNFAIGKMQSEQKKIGQSCFIAQRRKWGKNWQTGEKIPLSFLQKHKITFFIAGHWAFMACWCEPKCWK